MKTLTIRELPHSERPRDKAVRFGTESLSDSELLSIILGSGSKGSNALQTANHLLARFQNIRALSNASLNELKATPGIGPVRAVEIKACLEIARRFQQIVLRPGDILNGSRQVFACYHEKLRDYKKERFYCLLLDAKHRILKEELVSIGSLNFSIIHPREVFAPAIKEAAESILLLHNHPSGDPTPSREDIHITRRLVEVGKLVGIEVIDHIIIGNGCYVSFTEQKLL